MFYTFYKVMHEDTLYRLAELFDTTVAEIKRMNGLTGDVIRPGDMLLMKTEMPQWYQAGAVIMPQLTDAQLAAMAQGNGQMPPMRPNPEPELPQGCNQYTIQSGDTLYAIARANGTTVGILRAVNPGLDEKNLTVGSRICIPNRTENSYIYTVRPGDSPTKIANKFGVGVERLARANYLQSADTALIPGTQLLIAL